MFRKSSISALLLVFLLMNIQVTACAPNPPTYAPLPPLETAIIPTDTSIPPTFTLIPSPTSTAIEISPSPVLVLPTKTPVPPAEQQTVLIYLIAIGDNGTSGKLIGCGDSLIPVQVNITPTTGVLRAALNSLLSLKDQYYGESGLYNALYQSNLQVGDVSVTNGQAVVHLTGTLILGGVCDVPRVEAQLTEIAYQFSTVTSIEVYINGIPLKDALSLK